MEIGSFTKLIIKCVKLFIYNFSKVIPKQKKLFVFGSWFGNKFSDNSKYIFLHALNDNDIKAVWITKSKSVYNEMKKKGINEVLLSNSIEGIWTQLRAKVFFTSTGVYDMNEYLMGGALHVNLWHGLPLKKIMYDDEKNLQRLPRYSSKVQFIIDLLKSRDREKELTIATSKKIKEIYISAFKQDANQIEIFGQPRNDIFYLDNIDYLGVDPKILSELTEYKTVVYMPTHRQEGRVKQNLNEILDLGLIDDYCKENNILFIIKQHFYHEKQKVDVSNYNNIRLYNNVNIDTQILLKYTDLLITDYSSCYIDYLLLDRPIVFFAYDFEDYQLNDRELYFNYEDVTPGIKVYDKKSLLNAIIESFEKDNYSERRKEVLSLFYDEKARQPISNEILEYIKKKINL
ncbi:CDP-glycerol glycerophosphotransferase family protein [Anoxybacillus flavithermus]|uniref:CDP-glycerol--poly(Glycerophosphate) glycerophosphotransferase n=1 Tax=Anoxybacillus flavithermus TaxID=33934 RepID=A0AAX2A3G4_9BACL|nr:CDP-glycerol glycerophosphotransferase family protein [Anoxybacillus flavithermus]MBE2920985.1 CDP-glycerol--poly(glycerophosphate) glycerophosphotransferase [Anoxybacillus flavithermus]RWU15150.1 CDP-glycerol--poly(glycerophosphate) glycerophosphotransferase [Anoxybacillus flavithermus]